MSNFPPPPPPEGVSTPIIVDVDTAVSSMCVNCTTDHCTGALSTGAKSTGAQSTSAHSISTVRCSTATKLHCPETLLDAC